MSQQHSRAHSLSAIVGAAAVAVLPAALVAVSRARFDVASPLHGMNAPWRWSARDARSWWQKLTSGLDTSAELVDIFFRAGLVVAWACAAVLAYTIVSEILFQLRHGMPSSASHNLLGVGRLGRVIASGLIGLLPLSTATGGPALAGGPTRPATVSTMSTVSTIAQPAVPVTAMNVDPAGWVVKTEAPADWLQYVVQHGDSVWGIAGRIAGDRDVNTIAQQIIDANLGRVMVDGDRFTTPALIEPGWVLDIPASPIAIVTPVALDASTAAIESAKDVAGSPPPDPGTGVTASAPAPAEVAVVPYPVVAGDSYWAIAQDHLPADASDRTIAEYTRALIERNAPLLGYSDPRMLHPGDVIDLIDPAWAPASAPALAPAPADPAAVAEPSVPADTPAPTVTEPAAVPSAGELPVAAATVPSVVEPGSPADPAVVVQAPPTAPAAGPAAPSATDGSEAAAPSRSPVPATPGAAIAPNVDAAVVDDGIDQSAESPWAQVAFGVLLAGGVVGSAARLRRRRAARLAVGSRTEDPPEAAVEAEMVLSATMPQARMSTLTRLLKTLTPYAREDREPPLVRAVQLGSDGVEVLFTQRALVPPAGWETVNGGISWLHRLSEPIDDVATGLVSPSLITVGHVEDREILLDLDTAGTVAVVGSAALAAGVMRSMVLELATQPFGHWTDVLPVGFAMDGLDQLSGVWPVMTIQRAIRQIRATIDARAGFGATSIVEARAQSNGDDGLWNSTVVVVDQSAVAVGDGEVLNELVGLCQSGSGFVALLIGDHPDVRERLTVIDEHSAIWESVTIRTKPLWRMPDVDAASEPSLDDINECSALAGPASDPIAVTPPVVTLEAAAHVAVLLDHAANAAAAPAFETSNVDGDGDGDGEEFAVDDPVYVPLEFDLLVRVFGEDRVEPDVLTPRQAELLTLLALAKDRQAMNAAKLMNYFDPSGTTPVESLSRRVSEVRRVLGVDRHGELLILPAKTGRGAPGRYELSPMVVTDIDLLEHRLRAAKGLARSDALDVLEGGLGLLRGTPFAARSGYEWASVAGFTETVNAKVCAYVAAVIDVAVDADNIPLVQTAASMLTVVVDDPMVELPLARRIEEIGVSRDDPVLQEVAQRWRERLRTYLAEYDPTGDVG